MAPMAVAGGKFLGGSRAMAAHALDFFDLEATLRERLSAAVERDATVENLVILPESTRPGVNSGVQ